MLLIENTVVPSKEQWKTAIRGMRNPMNSWSKSDSLYYCDLCDDSITLGENDLKLMEKLCREDACCRKYLRMLTVYSDVTAPLYWWKEFDTYKIGTVANSCSTMHKIHSKEFTLDDFSCEHLIYDGEELKAKVSSDGYELCPMAIFYNTVCVLNACRENFINTKDKKYWWQMIQLLPSSYNQRRTIMVNYEVLKQIVKWRQNHKLDEWRIFCKWVLNLPYANYLIAEDGDKH